MFVRRIGAKWSLDGFEFVRTAPIGATEFDDGFCLVETDAMRSNSKAHVEKMEDRSRRGSKLEVGREMGAKILELGHPREKTEKIISGEEDIGDPFGMSSSSIHNQLVNGPCQIE